MKIRVKRSYAVRVEQTYEVDLADQSEFDPETDEDMIVNGVLIEDTENQFENSNLLIEVHSIETHFGDLNSGDWYREYGEDAFREFTGAHYEDPDYETCVEQLLSAPGPMTPIGAAS